MVMYFLICLKSIAAYLLGFQIEAREVGLIARYHQYHYKIKAGQWVTMNALAIAIILTVADFVSGLPTSGIIIGIVIAVGVQAILEWSLAKSNNRAICFAIRFGALAIAAFFMTYILGTVSLTAFIAAGLYSRNCPFGIAYGKDMALAYKLKLGKVKHTVAQTSGKICNVKDYGIMPDTKADCLTAVQELIDKVGNEGGGTIFFPKGRYLFYTSPERFLQINHSGITIAGETSADGTPLAELCACGAMSEGRKNPWLSPFFITTAEKIQPSNEFFGLQFRKPRATRMQSNSLSDPGSDGSILTPDYATKITAQALASTDIIEVADSSKVGKYIIIGMYNTTADGNLIKDILGTDSLRPEWTVANRAGIEEAPSFQLLCEVKEIIDVHRIRITKPLPRDIELCYEPEVWNAKMLEHINICNLKLTSRWNGAFHHHGFPIYYSIKQSQNMDYGWNAINMKRVAHGSVSNVIIRDFTNPLYVLDSRDITATGMEICGYDGHQGIKIYEHTCHCVFKDITFRNHFADMMGGEGNAYCNYFSNISYSNPVFKPVDFDFHGFSEGPMSPPAYNVFENIKSFRYIKSAGSITHLPSSAQGNIFRNLECEGERRGDSLFYAMTYRPKTGILRFITAVGYSVAMIQKTHKLSVAEFLGNVSKKLHAIDATNVPRSEHKQFFHGTIVENIDTWCKY